MITFAHCHTTLRAKTSPLGSPMEKHKFTILKLKDYSGPSKATPLASPHLPSLMAFCLLAQETAKSSATMSGRLITLCSSSKDTEVKFVDWNTTLVAWPQAAMITLRWFGTLLQARLSTNSKDTRLLSRPLPGAHGNAISWPLVEDLLIKQWNSGTSRPASLSTQ